MAYESLPEVPESDRPRPLYFRHTLTKEEQAVVKEKGWVPTDVRLLREPAEAIKATLEGARIGVIQLNDEDLSNLMAEAKVYGLLANKKAEEDINKDKGMEKDDLDSILSFANPSSSNNKNKKKVEETSEVKKPDRRKKKEETK